MEDGRSVYITNPNISLFDAFKGSKFMIFEMIFISEHSPTISLSFYLKSACNTCWKNFFWEPIPFKRYQNTSGCAPEDLRLPSAQSSVLFSFWSCFSALRTKFNTFRIPRKCYFRRKFRANFAVWPLIFSMIVDSRNRDCLLISSDVLTVLWRHFDVILSSRWVHFVVNMSSFCCQCDVSMMSLRCYNDFDYQMVFLLGRYINTFHVISYKHISLIRREHTISIEIKNEIFLTSAKKHNKLF